MPAESALRSADVSALVAVNAFQGVMIGISAVFLAMVVALGAWSTRTAADYLDWKPARPAGPGAHEDDEAEQLLAAQNAVRRRRGLPERTRDDAEADLRRAREELDGARAAPGEAWRAP